MPKLVLISDTHGAHRKIKIPDGDILIHAGDFMTHGKTHELFEFNEWVGTLPHKIKYLCPGNHDWACEKDFQYAKNILTNIELKCCESAKVFGLKFYFQPFMPTFCDWAFMLERKGQELAQKVSMIPEDTEVLVTHGPPWGIKDSSWVTNYKAKGCELLRDKVDTLRNLRLHVFGHIHGGYGREDRAGVIYVNAAQMTEEYKPQNKPIIVELS